MNSFCHWIWMKMSDLTILRGKTIRLGTEGGQFQKYVQKRKGDRF